MNILQFYKELYEAEIKRTDTLKRDVVFPAGIAILLIGVMGYYLREHEFYTLDFVSIVFSVFLLFSFLFWFIAIVFLIRSYFGYQYTYLPEVFKMKDYFDKLITFHESQGKNVSVAVNEFEEFLIDCYIASASKNTWANDSRSQFLHQANLFLMLAILFTVLSGIVFYVPILFFTNC